ncbi:hypothetical protein DFH09DRAFT_1285671 [Mycena vulgaris]|nr:hypothetical protein DFH09DRAFT_1285671 [Mycena vulgaris]
MAALIASFLDRAQIHARRIKCTRDRDWDSDPITILLRTAANVVSESSFACCLGIQYCLKYRHKHLVGFYAVYSKYSSLYPGELLREMEVARGTYRQAGWDGQKVRGGRRARGRVRLSGKIVVREDRRTWSPGVKRNRRMGELGLGRGRERRSDIINLWLSTWFSHGCGIMGRALSLPHRRVAPTRLARALILSKDIWCLPPWKWASAEIMWIRACGRMQRRPNGAIRARQGEKASHRVLAVRPLSLDITRAPSAHTGLRQFPSSRTGLNHLRGPPPVETDTHEDARQT